MYGDRKQIQAAATATGDGTKFHVRKLALTVFSVTGTFDGTITFEGTVDGANWSSIQVHNLSNGNVSTTATATGLYGCNVLGLGDVRARISAYTSGTISVEVRGVEVGSGESLADISFPPDASLTVDQPLHWLLNANVHLNVQASEVNAANPVPVSQIGPVSTVNLIHDHFNVNANLQVNNIDVSTANPVPIETAGLSITQTPTVTAGAYSANDAVGGLLTFSDAARKAGYGGVIKDMLILDDAGQDAEMELWLFRETFTAETDNDGWSPSEADLRKLVGIITTSDGAWFAAGTPSAARVEASQRYDLVGTSLYGQLVTRGTPTFSATDDVTVIIGLLLD